MESLAGLLARGRARLPSPAWLHPGLWRRLPRAGRSASLRAQAAVHAAALRAGVPERPSALRNPPPPSTAPDGPRPMASSLWTEAHVELLYPCPVRLPPRQSQAPRCQRLLLPGPLAALPVTPGGSARERRGDPALGTQRLYLVKRFTPSGGRGAGRRRPRFREKCLKTAAANLSDLRRGRPLVTRHVVCASRSEEAIRGAYCEIVPRILFLGWLGPPTARR